MIRLTLDQWRQLLLRTEGDKKFVTICKPINDLLEECQELERTHLEVYGVGPKFKLLQTIVRQIQGEELERL